jgi:hypothetical protein
MSTAPMKTASADLLEELERKYFWWKHAGSEARSESRILAQAMELASFSDIQRIEAIFGRDRLVTLMQQAEPGWISARSWEFWRGRLSAATRHAIADAPPRRAFHADAV